MRRAAFILAYLLGLKAGAQQQTALKLVRTIPLPGVAGRIDHMAVDTQHHRLFIAALGNNTVEVVDCEGGKHLRTIKNCSEPQGLVYLGEPNRLFVANGGSGEMQIFDGAAFQRLKTIGSLPDADDVLYAAAENSVYVGFGDGSIGVINPKTDRLVSRIELGAHPESFQIEGNGSRAFVNVPIQHAVVVVNPAQQTVLTKWHLEPERSNFPMALDEAGHRLFVGCRSPARLLVLDTEDGKTVGRTEISGDTDDLFFDAKRQRVYASCGEGFLDVIQRGAGDRYERIAHEPTRSGARTSVYSPEFDRLFLAVPQRSGQSAEIQVYQPESP